LLAWLHAACAGITVVGVTRIHNRWLRNRFERQLSSLVDMGEARWATGSSERED
jgi:hypothetical protein